MAAKTIEEKLAEQAETLKKEIVEAKEVTPEIKYKRELLAATNKYLSVVAKGK